MATYYIDPSGSDITGNGTSGNPWRSLSYACGQVTTSGDKIHINSGTYDTDSSYCNLSVGVEIEGTGKSLVTIPCASGHPTYGSYITLYSASQTNGNQTIHDFSINGGGSTTICGMRSRGRYNVKFYNLGISNFHKADAPSCGLRVEGAVDGGTYTEPSWYATDVEIHDNVFTNTSYGVAEPFQQHYGALEIESLDGALIYNNTFNESGTDRGVGIKYCSYLAGWFKGIKIYNNTMYMNPADGNAFVLEVYNFHNDSEIYGNIFNGPFSLNGGPATRTSGSTWNLKIYANKFDLSNFTYTESFVEASHNWLLFDRNYVIGHGPNYVRGIGVWVTNFGTVSNVQISNNVVYNTAETSIYIDAANGSVNNVGIYNNTIDTVSGTWGGFGISKIGTSACTGIIAKNNIVRSAVNRWLYLLSGANNGTYTYNMRYNCGNSNDHYDNGSGNTIGNNILADPQWVGSGDRPGYYKPSSVSSNMVDVGTSLSGINDHDYDNVVRPQNSIWDIGAYEYEGGITKSELMRLRESVTVQRFPLDVTIPLTSDKGRLKEYSNVQRQEPSPTESLQVGKKRVVIG